MSHFSLHVVITEEEIIEQHIEPYVNNIAAIENIIEEKLEPFDESLEFEPYVFKTKEELIKDRRQNIKDAMNTRVAKEYFENPIQYVKENPDEKEYIKHILGLQDELSKSDDELWLDIEPMLSDVLDKDNNYISTHNKQGKWDWWVIGGRFENTLLDKNNNKVTIIKVKDLSTEPEEKEIERSKRFWEIIVEKEEPKTEEEKAITTFYNENYYLDKYGNKEEFVKHQTSNLPYALLVNNEWIEPGKMLSFGMDTSNANTQKKFRKEYKEILKGLNDNDIIVVVDCHT